MDANEFQKKCFRTERPERLNLSVDTARLLHGATGLASEGGELLDNVKAHLFYGKELDKTNVLEECGDALWFIAVALDSCGYTIQQAMEMNVAKLAARYPDGFSTDRALNRDIGLERSALEKP
jgi:NTP pyrophosphatase (non-canonical NTP hydrolase)